MGELCELNPTAVLPDSFEYVDLESVAGTDMISHRREEKLTAPSRAQRLASFGDIFYQTVRPYQKNNYFYELPDEDYVFSTGYAQLRPLCDGRFLFSSLQRDQFVSCVLEHCTGTSYPAINANDLAALFLAVPSDAEEQRLVGSILKPIDSLITLHQRKCQYRSLYGYLSWEQRKLGEFSKKRTTKNADGTLSETFTNSAEQGVISQLDYFDHDITNDANISGYYVVQPDDFVYNPRISATAPCGPINRNRLDRAGVMSPLYTVFSVDASVDKTYLEHYFKTSRWHDFMFLEGNSGARSDRFSISDATFFEMPIWCPEISEQKAMAKQLETTDHLITLHQRQSNGKAYNIIILSRTKNRQLDIAKSAVLGLETRGNSRKLLNEHPIQQRFLDIP